MCPKIVQKYIERPYLLRFGENDNRKFDIRQWVFVNSFDPLDVYIYRKAYLRICAQNYDVDQFSDLTRHISNYSINKEAELTMSTDQFEEYLENRDVRNAGKKWDSFFLPKITDIIRTTLRQMADQAIENRPNSFELYGFDFVLDKDLNPWMIEANMSPACAERKDWLVEMLDDMGNGVVNLIEAKVKFNRMISRHTFEVQNAN
jgi:tubulin monoglycylase TTLL3/8